MSRLQLLSCLLPLLAIAAHRANAELPVRPYPDPGHRWLGVYGGGNERHFDYDLKKLSLSDSFPDKAAWWAGLKANRSGRSDPHRHDVYLVYCGERDGAVDIAKRRLDAWLESEPDRVTFPELIPAICLGEENVGARREVLDVLARHVREKYGIPVFQWYSDPSPPDLDLTADGWIWDSYGWDSVRFRKHVMKFVVLGKPVLCVPWAADPHWPQWTQYPTAAALMDREWRQFDVCREFNVSCAAFAVAGPTGSVSHWMETDTPEMVLLRGALRGRREAMHVQRPGELPLSSADFSARDRAVSVGGDPGAPSLYEETFSGFGWLHDADVRGFRNLKLASRPAVPGALSLATKAGQPVRASLVWRFESYFPLDSVHVELDAAAPAGARARNRLSISTDETAEAWPLEVQQEAAEQPAPLVLEDNGALKGRHVFFVRLVMENHAERTDLAGNQLDRLRVRCTHQPPPEGAAAMLSSDEYGNLSYRDDFHAPRWPHLGKLEVAHPNHGGFRDAGFWVGMKGGYVTSTRLVQRFTSRRPLRELAVEVDCYADATHLGGSVTLSVAPSGGQPQWSIDTKGVHQGPLKLVVPASEAAGLERFDVCITLSSNSGVEHNNKACATLNGLSIRAK